ncbi:hypothetical protein Q31b_11730 [Novipirellula aureliae]|uniref:Uncharacterized protein n=1 Tax=Novipirellula aureliae TaxID=2527966 RepID=A0A5C6EEL9_9BACT|nr:hypothetical protein Q31b_11730 [Novipirellula aureliae]
MMAFRHTPTIKRQTWVTKKQTITPMTRGRRVAIAVHFQPFHWTHRSRLPRNALAAHQTVVHGTCFTRLIGSLDHRSPISKQGQPQSR